MPEIKLKARIQNKYETLKDWERIGEGQFIPLKGEVCYAVDQGLVYQKIGDGVTDFTKLPWLLNQGDNSVNDENSPAYIKNRLAYPEYTEVPEEDQLLSQTSYFALDFSENKFIYAPTDIATYWAEWPSLKEEVLKVLENVEHIIMAENEGVYCPYSEILEGEYNSFSFTLFNEDNDLLTIYENEKTKMKSSLTISGMNIYCLGNSDWGNIFANFLSNNGTGTFTQYFPKGVNTEANYCMLNLGPIKIEDEDDGSIYLSFLIIDSDNYQPVLIEQEDSIDYAYGLNFKILEQGKIHTIDSKYLGNIQPDQRIWDSTQQNYIKNRYADDYVSMQIAPNAGLSSYKADITFNKINAFGSLGIKSETVSSYLDDESLSALSQCYVYINDTLYTDVPVFQRITDLVDNEGESDFIIGNPYLVSKTLLSIKSAYEADGSEIGIVGINVSVDEDNGLPFAFSLCQGSATPLWDGAFAIFNDYSTESTIHVEVIPQTLKYGGNIIPKTMLPKDAVVGEYNENCNSVLLNSAYEATGANSLAIGKGTKALGENSFALGEETTTGGKNTIAAGISSEAKGQQSMALGNNVKVNGYNTLGLGENLTIGNSDAMSSTYRADNTLAVGEYIVAYGKDNIAVGYRTGQVYYSCERPSDTTAVINADEFYYNFVESGRDWIPCTHSISDGKCTITFEEPIDIGSTSLPFCRGTRIGYSAQGSIVAGQGAVSNHSNSAALGKCVETGAANQLVIGESNKLSDGVFIVGNGSNITNRSNALEISKQGNITTKGTLNFETVNGKFENYLDLSNVISEKLKVSITNPKNYTLPNLHVCNKNYWPATGWATPDENGIETETYTNGSKIEFYPDGSIHLNYVAGDTITITRSANKSSSDLWGPKGKYILSNGLKENSNIYFYVSSTSHSTNENNGVSTPVNLAHRKLTIGIRTADKTQSFEAVYYPQLELGEQPTSFVKNQREILSFNTSNELYLNLLKYKNWQKPYLVLSDTDTNFTLNYEGTSLDLINILPDLNRHSRKQVRYIFDLENLSSDEQVNYSILDNTVSLQLSIDLGYKNSSSENWESYYQDIKPSQLEILDLYGDSMLTTPFGEHIEGYRLSDGYLINTKENWSFNSGDLRDLMTNLAQNMYENGHFRLNKYINSADGLEHCRLEYFLYVYEADEETTEALALLSQVDKLICYLPEGCENIFVN